MNRYLFILLEHQGCLPLLSRAATDILSAVESAMSKYSTTKVSIVGHSLGAFPGATVLSSQLTA